jgi:DNA-binding transcriptional ArsR family regulator
MRLPVHPQIQDISVEGIFHALSDSTRAAIYVDLVAAECSLNCSSFVGIGAKILSRPTLSHHFSVLREAGLIRSVRRGREIHNFSRSSEIEDRFPGLMRSIVEAFSAQGETATDRTTITLSRNAER